MELFENLDNLYKANIEEEDKLFLEKLKNVKTKKERDEIEREYRLRLKKFLEEYNKNVSKLLGKKNIIFFEKQEKEKEKEDKDDITRKGVLTVNPIKIQLNLMERNKIKFKLFLFNLHLKIKNLIHRLTPSFLKMFFLRKIMMARIFLLDSKSFIFRIFDKIKSKIVNYYEKVKELFLKFLAFTKKQSLVFLDKISFWKKKEKLIDKEKKGEKKSIASGDKENKKDEDKEGKKEG